MRVRTLLSTSCLLVELSAASADVVPTELCRDESDVVGERSCTPYGSWSVPVDERNIFIDYGANWRRFQRVVPVKPATTPTTARATSVATPSSPMPAEAPASVLAFTERIGFAIAGAAHFAIEVELGNFAFDSTKRDIMLGTAGAFGLFGNLGSLGIGVELAAGYRGYTDESHEGFIGGGVLEARARAQLWSTPWFTLGVAVGSSLLHKNDWMAGIALGFHSRSYGGR